MISVVLLGDFGDGPGEGEQSGDASSEQNREGDGAARPAEVAVDSAPVTFLGSGQGKDRSDNPVPENLSEDIAGTHPTTGGPKENMRMKNPPEGNPPPDATLDEIIAFDKIKEAMPDAYHVGRDSAVPGVVVSPEPPKDAR